MKTEKGPVVCQLRGKLRQGKAAGDLAALGDRVCLEVQDDGSGVIHSVEPRLRAIVRLDPRPRGAYQQILLANPDQAVFVFACAQPDPHLRMLDRFLVVAEKQRVPAVIVANKVDLVSPAKAREIFGLYESLGYPVIYASARTGAGVRILYQQLVDKISAFAGPSGAGKSSLLNAIQPHLGLAVNAIGAMNKGQHTTVVRELFPLGRDRGYVADTPGWKSLALWDTRPEEIDAYFRELAPLVANCRYGDCTHTHEPGCAVLAAVEAGQVSPGRYDSYVRLRQSGS